MSELRVVFFGTPDFAVASLASIYSSNHKILAVITTTDKRQGRGKKVVCCAVKSFAKEKNLLILQPENLKKIEFIQKLQNLKADVFVVVAFRKLPKLVWEIPRYGTFNLHASLLPNYRGSAPINWAIINGENQTGVTTFFINDKIDEGNILLQKEVIIQEEYNVQTLYIKLMNVGAKLVIETLERISNHLLTEKPQDINYRFKKAPKLIKDNCKINWNQSMEKVNNFIRGLSPIPAAWSVLKNGSKVYSFKIYKVEKIIRSDLLNPGIVVIDKNEILVAVKDGFVRIIELQMENKKKMKAKEFLNGFKSVEKIIFI